MAIEESAIYAAVATAMIAKTAQQHRLPQMAATAAIQKNALTARFLTPLFLITEPIRLMLR